MTPRNDEPCPSANAGNIGVVILLRWKSDHFQYVSYQIFNVHFSTILVPQFIQKVNLRVQSH